MAMMTYAMGQYPGFPKNSNNCRWYMDFKSTVLNQAPALYGHFFRWSMTEHLICLHIGEVYFWRKKVCDEEAKRIIPWFYDSFFPIVARFVPNRHTTEPCSHLLDCWLKTALSIEGVSMEMMDTWNHLFCKSSLTRRRKKLLEK